MAKRHQNKSKTRCKLRHSRIPDMLVVEPSECDRSKSNKLEELVETCWLLTRPPPVLYDRHPTMTARRMEVARFRISGDGEEPILVRQNFDNCYGPGHKADPKRYSEPPVRPRVRLRTLERQTMHL